MLSVFSIRSECDKKNAFWPSVHKYGGNERKVMKQLILLETGLAGGMSRVVEGCNLSHMIVKKSSEVCDLN
jgi:hypothetical protein